MSETKDEEVASSVYSTNEKAEQVMGRRRTDVVFFDYPCELGYRCPVCAVQWDEALEWSEYRGFIWCPRCDRDYPSCFCVPVNADPNPERPHDYAGWDDAVKVFLDIVQDAKSAEDPA